MEELWVSEMSNVWLEGNGDERLSTLRDSLGELLSAFEVSKIREMLLQY